jgi:hypothetical protein
MGVPRLFPLCLILRDGLKMMKRVAMTIALAIDFTLAQFSIIRTRGS